MGDYIQLTFKNISPGTAEILIARLSDEGFEGFEEGDNEIKAFVPAANFNQAAVLAVARQAGADFVQGTIPQTNWNAVWESNFDPVVVDDFVAVRAEFHAPAKGVVHEIVITPKMSFGTGHHATTFMMMQQMRNIAFGDRRVLDFGTGTGVLAILAEKLGASDVLAIDNDDWSIENARENIWRNNCSHIRLEQHDTVVTGAYDVILANINKNVIIESFEQLAGSLKKGGTLLLSGLLPEDKNDIFRKNAEYSLQIVDTFVRANWLCIKLSC